MQADQGKRTLGEGRFLRLVDDRGWEYVERKTCRAVVAIAALTPENKILLVEQVRASMGGTVIELPAGLVGDDAAPEETLLDAAGRELLEETGYCAAKLEIVAAGPSSTGLTNEIITYVRATQLEKKTAGGGVDDEQIKVHEVELDRVDAWLAEKLRQGVRMDPRIYVGLYFLRPRP